MRRRSETDQYDGYPKIRRLGRKDDRHDCQRANQHRHLPTRIDGPTALDQRRREPAAANAADVCHQINDDERWSEVFQIETVAFVQKVGQPEEVDPPDRIRHELRDARRPTFAGAAAAVPTECAPPDPEDRSECIRAQLSKVEGCSSGVGTAAATRQAR